ncbi:MAG: alpha/beta hydrolase [Egibacteraceae bacterium]
MPTSTHPTLPTVRRLLLVLVLALTGLATGCSPRRAAESLLLRGHFEVTVGVPYGAADRQRLDVYRPRSAAGEAPVVVFLYGGRWQSGSRDDYRLLGDALTRRGLVAVVPDYRLYPDVLFPAWVEDAARAVAWTRAHAARFGGDPDRIFVVGHSAGAHTAALLALDPRHLAGAGVGTMDIAGYVSIAGPVHIAWTDVDVQALMGPREGWPATYPATHVRGGAPPLLLLHGSDDSTVSVENSRRLAARLEAEGGCPAVVVYPGIGHIGIIVALSVPRLGIAPVMDGLVRFIRTTPSCP